MSTCFFTPPAIQSLHCWRFAIIASSNSICELIGSNSEALATSPRIGSFQSVYASDDAYVTSGFESPHRSTPRIWRGICLVSRG
jgi:hypothetical protein